MLNKLLGEKLYSMICSRYNIEHVYEVRIRCNSPIVINYMGINVYLKNSFNEVVLGDKSDIERVISISSNYSLYTVENQIKQAFITAENGYRIGLSGEIVSECGISGIRSIKNIYSVNIRVPHLIHNCSYKIFKYICNSKIKNTLIISKPGAGKTTYLRDICYQFSKLNKPYNVLLIDERYEIAGVKNGLPSIEIGGCVDILSGASKEFGFNQGIRSLKPDVILTDELQSEKDYMAVIRAINSGVNVIATIHASSIEMLKQKEDFKEIINGRYFDNYILLSNNETPGKCEGVYDKNFKLIYC